ncbi:MAG TPA: DUF2207 domain-containing protein [Thermomicrobiales bacterium]
MPFSGKRCWALVVAILGLVLTTAWLPGSATAAFGVTWARYDVTLDLLEDGTYHVVERQTVVFGPGFYSEGFAEIPTERIDAIENVVVREETPGGLVTYEELRYCCPTRFKPGTYAVDYESTSVTILWGFESASDETRIFVLEYDVRGALRVYDDPDPSLANQQIWWTAIGPEVTDVGPVREATVTVHLPRAVPLADTVIATNDDLGNPEKYTTDGQTWTWSVKNLGRGEKVEIRLQFPQIVDAQKPTWQQRDDDRRRREEEAEERRMLLNSMFLGAGLLGLVVGGLLVYGLWYLRGRDPHTGVVADFLPEPPDDLPPGAAGALVDEIVHERDVVATLVDLARRGVISMKESSTGWGTDIDLTLLAPDAPVTKFEKGVLEALFGYDLKSGQGVSLYQVRSQFERAVPTIRALLGDELVERGYFTTNPDVTRETWRDRALRGLLLTLIGGFAIWLLFFRDTGWIWFPIGVVSLVWIAIYLLSGAMPRKTPAGAEAAARWLAFRRYLAEIERYDRLSEARDRFERFLPYAIAFGLEESWVTKFAAAGAQAPSWYQPDIPTVTDWDRPASQSMRRWSTSRRRATWWDIAGAEPRRSSGGGSGRGWSLPGLPDLQGTSDHAARSLSRASNGLLQMFDGAGRALSSFAEWSSSGSGGGGSRRSGSWGGSSRRSGGFRGGGSRRGSSGGGRRGFR